MSLPRDTQTMFRAALDALRVLSETLDFEAQHAQVPPHSAQSALATAIRYRDLALNVGRARHLLEHAAADTRAVGDLE